jgi:nucleotide-binding universal stress UspA family protein
MDSAHPRYSNTTRLIVVGVDGSEEAEQALRWVTHLARSAQALIQVVVVCGADEAAVTEGWSLVDAVVTRALTISPGIPIAGDVLTGDPVDALVTAALGATMLVLGSHGRSGRFDAAMGSVADACIRTARCPVVVVPARGRIEAASGSGLLAAAL